MKYSIAFIQWESMGGRFWVKSDNIPTVNLFIILVMLMATSISHICSKMGDPDLRQDDFF